MSEFESISIYEDPGNSDTNPEVTKVERYTTKIDLKPLKELHDLVKQNDSEDILPKLNKYDTPQYVVLDPVYKRLNNANQRDNMELNSPIYDSLVATIGKMPITPDNFEFGIYCATSILHLQRKIYEEIRKSYIEDQKLALKYSSGATLREANMKNFWAEALDMATVNLLESINDLETDKATFEYFVVTNPALKNRTVDVSRLVIDNGMTETIGGNAAELEALAQDELDNAVEFLTNIGLGIGDMLNSIAVIPPELELARKAHVLGYAASTPTVYIGITSQNPITEQLMQSERVKFRLLGIEDYLGHEIVHGLTSLDLTVEYSEGLAVLYQMLYPKGKKVKSVQNVFREVNGILHDGENFLERVERASGVRSISETVSKTEIYTLPAAFLYAAYTEQPMLCGEILKTISSYRKVGKEVKINEITEISAKNIGSDITPDQIEKKAQELMAQNNVN